MQWLNSSILGDNPRYRSEVYNRALCPTGEFKMRAAANPGLHGVRKDVRIVSIFSSVLFKYNLSIHLKHFQ